MAHAFVAIGSNINPAENVRHAILALAGRERLAGISTVYRTAALGRPEQASYYNCVVQIETETAPAELKHHVLRPIEHALGRVRSADKFASRTIDLDLIAYDSLALETEDITLPDPDILQRPFLALPLCELAPALVLAGYDVPIREVAAGLARAGMEALDDYTKGLRNELGLGVQC